MLRQIYQGRHSFHTVPPVVNGRDWGSIVCDCMAAASLVQQVPACNWSSGVLLCEGWGLTASQLYLPSPTPLFIAGCGRLQLGAAHWATSVALLQLVDN